MCCRFKLTDKGQFLAAMCQTTGERLPAAWIISRIRIAAAAPLVLVRRGEGSGSARVCACEFGQNPGSNREPSAGGDCTVRVPLWLFSSSFSFFPWAREGCVLLAPPFVQPRSSGRHLTKRADKQTAFIVSYSWTFFLKGVGHGLLTDGGAT